MAVLDPIIGRKERMAAVERKQQIIRIQNAQRGKAAKKEAHKRRVLGSRLLLPYLRSIESCICAHK